MRGAFEDSEGNPISIGITPAHAGSIIVLKMIGDWVQDHPRACGEHVCTCQLPSRSWGSPPRMRGAFGAAGPLSAKFRITPAHAGSINGVVNGLTNRKDHPRACGEH